jgi:hypothetical protein
VAMVIIQVEIPPRVKMDGFQFVLDFGTHKCYVKLDAEGNITQLLKVNVE